MVLKCRYKKCEAHPKSCKLSFLDALKKENSYFVQLEMK